MVCFLNGAGKPVQSQNRDSFTCGFITLLICVDLPAQTKKKKKKPREAIVGIERGKGETSWLPRSNGRTQPFGEKGLPAHAHRLQRLVEAAHDLPRHLERLGEEGGGVEDEDGAAFGVCGGVRDVPSAVFFDATDDLAMLC